MDLHWESLCSLYPAISLFPAKWSHYVLRMNIWRYGRTFRTFSTASTSAINPGFSLRLLVVNSWMVLFVTESILHSTFAPRSTSKVRSTDL